MPASLKTDDGDGGGVVSSKAELVSLMEFEIVRGEKTRTRPGWTRWALLVALGACLWVLIEEIGSRDWDWVSPALVLILLFSVAEIVAAIWYSLNLVNRAHPTDGNSRYLPFSRLVDRRRTEILFESARSAAVICLVLCMAPLLSITTTWTLSILFGVNLLAVGIVILLSFFDVPVPLAGKHGAARPGHAIFAIIGMVGVASLVTTMVKSSEPITPKAWKAAGLAFACILVLKNLVAEGVYAPLLGRLIELRRKVGLGEADVASARDELDIILRGMKTSHLVRKELDKAIEASVQLAAVMERSREMIVLAAEHLPGSAAACTKEEVIRLRSLLRSAKEFDPNGTPWAVKLKEATERVRNRLSWIEVLADEPDANANELATKLDSSVKTAKKAIDEATESIRAFERRLHEFERDFCPKCEHYDGGACELRPTHAPAADGNSTSSA